MAFSKTQEREQTEFSNRPQPIDGKLGATIIGPTNPTREAENPDTLAPPRVDHGTLANLRWSFADSHVHLSEGGWGRQTTARELPIATEVAGVNMRLTPGGVREMHWHKAAEWAYGPLRRHQPPALHNKFGAFRLTAEDRMVFKNKTLQLGIPFLEEKRSRESADAAPDDNTVEDFTRVDYVLRKRGKDVIADLVAGGYHLVRVPIGPRIVTHASRRVRGVAGGSRNREACCQKPSGSNSSNRGGKSAGSAQAPCRTGRSQSTRPS
jgi:hypothetical protein